jgi:murein DD-endopeptidase MepM/ murein hydrolase activator NlpD
MTKVVPPEWVRGRRQLNIILVSGDHARARTVTLDWRHWLAGGLALFVLFIAFTLLFNFLTLRWAAAIQHPWLQAIVLADQREEARRNLEKTQGHINAMALRLGELQARVLRLDGLGERLAKSAGLNPQELPAATPQDDEKPAKDDADPAPGRGGPVSSLPARSFTEDEFEKMLAKLTEEVDVRTDQYGVLEALLVQDSAMQKFLPTHEPIPDHWFSSNFGYRIDPFTGLRTFHEGIDFPANVGTVITAAASGKVIFADVHPEYGKMVDIDHGNGLVTRYAHARKLLVKVGDLVLRGQPIAEVGTTGRTTGPHLHYEVRLNGTPQNPARFFKPG